jgi:hypothetical protein
MRWPDKRRIIEWLIALGTLFALILAFALLPVPGGIDWETFYGAAQRIWTGQPIYGEMVTEHSHFYNPPWVAVILAPLGLLPSPWGRAILSAATLLLVAATVQHWRGGIVRLILALLSPLSCTLSSMERSMASFWLACYCPRSGGCWLPFPSPR